MAGAQLSLGHCHFPFQKYIKGSFDPSQLAFGKIHPNFVHQMWILYNQRHDTSSPAQFMTDMYNDGPLGVNSGL